MAVLHKRRYPRRRYFHRVGVLHAGKYVIGQGVELGEGGMRLDVDVEIPPGGLVVLSFLVSEKVYVITKAEMRYKAPNADDKSTQSYGMMFHGITFDKKRAIRDYISAKTEAEAELEMAASSAR